LRYNLPAKLAIVIPFCVLTIGAHVGAQVTITSGPSGPVPGTPGSGLNGSYFGEPFSGSNANALSYIAGNSPLMTFTASEVDFPGGNTSVGDGTTLGSFLSVNGTNESTTAFNANNLSGQLFQFNGYLAVDAAGTVNFTLNSDDGSLLDIAGQTVLDNDGAHGYGGPSGGAVFSAAGLYSISVTYWEQGGGTGVGLLSDQTGTSAIIPTNFLYQTSGQSPGETPEPGSLAMLGGLITFGASFAFMRRRR
jgi:hypothetical protein